MTQLSMSPGTKDGEPGEVEKWCLSLQFRTSGSLRVSDTAFEHISS